MSSQLLHEALNRQASLAEHRSPLLGAARSVTSSSDIDSDDDAYTPVHTRPGTPSSRARDRARPAEVSSRASTPAGSRSSSPSRIAKKKMAEEAERRASRDPLWRFDNDVSSRIFRELDVVDLARCARVCKRWRRSATINWAWYLRFQEQRSEDPLSRAPIWTRREAKENWAQRYRSAFTLNGLQYQTAFEAEYERARSDGYRTPKEEREQRWADQATTLNQPTSLSGEDKIAAREYYKSLGGRKVKGKGTGVSGPRDRTAYGEEDY